MRISNPSPFAIFLTCRSSAASLSHSFPFHRALCSQLQCLTDRAVVVVAERPGSLRSVMRSFPLTRIETPKLIVTILVVVHSRRLLIHTCPFPRMCHSLTKCGSDFATRPAGVAFEVMNFPRPPTGFLWVLKDTMPLVLRRSCMNLTSNLKLEGTYQCVSCRGDLCQQAHKEDGIALFAKPKFKVSVSFFSWCWGHVTRKRSRINLLPVEDEHLPPKDCTMVWCTSSV